MADLARVHSAAWDTVYRGILPDRIIEEAALDRRIQNWNRAFSDPNRQNLVYIEDGRLLGFLSYRPSRDSDAGPVSEVIACYVHPDAWRRGIGRSLWSAARERIVQNWDSALVWVLRDNHMARAFYESIDFVYDRESDRPLAWCPDVIEVRLGAHLSGFSE
ncbi:MAG: GNAT family N-acetyltransferase [Gemmatimonadetes bacterium]|nr:GNAT family N-acetyltransferase [Gemmatimonadota bacterium]